ncbi:MAG: NUDIX hydrolase [Dehalococcoidia bacterium]|nr:NUDIX hydrolase [Dehalococcoidia bacterium]
MTVRHATSSGGVVYRVGAEGPEIVLVSRRSPILYALPKGTPDPGETSEETALREVQEETGLQVRLVAPVGDVHYWFTAPDGDRVDKVVHFYLMEPTGGDEAAHDHEFDDVGWYHLAEAERLMTHKNQMHILYRAAELIATLTA